MISSLPPPSRMPPISWPTSIPHSLEILPDARLEPALAGAEVGVPVQFERQGYFCLDPGASAGRLIFNRTVGLRDTWAKESRKAG